MAKSQTLLKTQRNEVFKILQDAGLEVADFSWVDVLAIRSKGGTVSCLNYKEGRLHFKFDYDFLQDFWICEFSPGEEVPVEKVRKIDSLEDMFGYVCMWAESLKEEIDAPDLWGEIQKYQPIFSLAPREQIVNEPIPAYEAEEISKALNKLTAKVTKHFQLSQEQGELVRFKLDYLSDAVKRQGRLDWVHTCIGVFITIAMGLAMAPEQAKELWTLFKEAMGHFVHLVAP